MTGQLAAEKADPPESTAAQPVGRRLLPDCLAIAAVLALFPVVHDVRGMLTASYSLDEAWVAMSVRFPVSDVLAVTSSTPVGWTLLLRPVPDTDYLRVVPFLFHLLGIAAAYLFARALAWRTTMTGRIAGLTCAGAVLLLPAQQIRHDLKQYTADAAVTLALLALAALTEGSWSRRRLGTLVALVPVGMAVSHVTAIVAPCVFVGFAITAAATRRWRRLAETAVAGSAAAACILGAYLAASARGNNRSLKDFWAANMPSAAELPGYLDKQADTLIPAMGAPAVLLLILLACGVATIAAHGRPAAATTVVLLPLAAVTLGVAKVYPLLELRTSHFLLVATAAVAGIGAAGAATTAADLAGRFHRRLPPTLVAAALTGVLLVGFAAANLSWYRFDGDDPRIPIRTMTALEDVRSATAYVRSHRAAQDVILVSGKARYGFVFYWDQDPVRRVPHGNAVGWHVLLPTQPHIVFAGEDEAGIRRSLQRAFDIAASRGPGTRVWLIRSHVIGAEPAAWQAVLADYRVEQVTTGMEPVAVLTP
jgi:hypothetical protein